MSLLRSPHGRKGRKLTAAEEEGQRECQGFGRKAYALVLKAVGERGGRRESREGTRHRMGGQRMGQVQGVKGTFREVGDKKTEWWGLSSLREDRALGIC